MLLSIAELKASRLVEELVDGAAQHVKRFGATDVALVLDGLARLRIQPPAILLSNHGQIPLATRCQRIT